MPSKPEKLKNLLEDRIRVIIRITILAAVLLVGRLYYLQVLQHEQYTLLANKNRIRIMPTIPKRGRILASDGSVLAFTGVQHRLTGNTASKKALTVDLTLLQKDSQYKELANTNLLKKMKKSPPFRSIVIKDKIDWPQVTGYIPLLTKYKSFNLESCYYRVYPLRKAACHITGYLSAPPPDEANSTILPIEYKFGKTGIEQHFNEKLAGELGVKKIEINALGIPVRDLQDNEAENGEDLETTIDAELQQFVYELLLKYKAASCVVMNIENGHILAMVSVPGYDPDELTSNKRYWQNVTSDALNPLTNRSISGLYPPGSTFKPIVALAALKAGVIDKDTTFFCPGSMRICNHTYHCWKHSGHGHLNLEQAIAKSCDVFFFNLALRLKLSDITDMAEIFGIGLKTGIDLPYEKSGSLPTGKLSHWKRRYTSQKVLLSIGQGAVTLTPIQLCVMVAQLANNGYRISPILEKGKNYPREALGVSLEHIKLTKNGMFLVCNMPGASGYANGYNPKYPIAGKTGTAQVVSLSDKRGHLWQYKDHGLFIGYAPIDHPKYAVSVVIDHGVSGSASCVPVARKIFDYISNKNEKI